DFGPENFVAEAYRVNLGSLAVKSVDPLPVKRQSVVTALVEETGQGRRPVHGGGASEALAFALGGFGHDGEVARSHADLYRYDLSRRAWETLGARLPEPRSQFGLAEHGGKLWLFGGLDYDPRRDEDSFRHPREVLTLDLKDPTAFARSAAELPRPRRAFGGAILDGRYYLVGGMREKFQVVEECDVFDFTAGTWETIPAPARPRISPELVSLGGRLYLAGGSSPKASGGFEPNTSLECYDRGTKQWSVVLDTLPLPTEHVRMLRLRDRLLLYSTHHREARALQIVIVEPPRAGRSPGEQDA
ncbi:MAG TPA: kelch repeat-containing protein, partial [Longimicrobiaceae bacterium]|nr:kelch repeat-containing protein [Longimicrobiaceae bacterium]